MITAAIWVYCIKGYRPAKGSVIPRETAISQSAIHSDSLLRQEWLFRTPADLIGRHHNRKKLNRVHAAWGAFMAQEVDPSFSQAFPGCQAAASV
jgi:hypothetical protein